MKLIKSFFILFFLGIITLNAQNLQELQKLQEEYKKALERQSLQKPPDITEAEKTAKSTVLPDKLVYSRKDIESLLVNTEKLLLELKFLKDSTNRMPFVGYDFFTKRDSIPFWQNLPISNNYILGPGDEIIISLWGETNSSFSETINRDGQIFIENIGIINLGGMSLADSKEYIISKFSRVFSTLIGQSPKSFIDLTIGELKSININFVGFVNIPGVHVVHPFSNVITGLVQAGGVDNRGSLREIRIVRDNKTIKTIDLYSYLIEGKPLSDLRLMDQDIIYVSPRKSTIPVTGRVKKHGYYEILENESLRDVINFAGGFERRSSQNIYVFRNGHENKDGYIINSKSFSTFLISKGDSIHIPQEPNIKKFINIQGQVMNPGYYPFNSDMALKDILNATMSYKDNDFYETMNLSEIKIFRKNPDNETPIMLTINIKDRFMLKNGDFITIPSKNKFNPIEAIKITGEIKNPGIYPVNELATLEEIINLSGGLTSNALQDGIEVFRDSLKIAWDQKSFPLIDGDSINVLKKSGLVLLSGEVNVPGYLSFKKNDSIKNYIKRAGGLTEFAEKNNIYIIYPNGVSIPFSRWSSPKVKEGSIIHINQRTISGEQELNGLQIFSTISSQAGNIATTLISLSLLINQSSNGN
tara:strand:- start:2350 stop:4278 length:1929 start_codon:yes stop_codon:yes gene_type:complete